MIASVLYVPGVRNAFNLASLIADTTFVDRDYVRTEIGDDVQLVELSSEKFRYPDGYFATEAQLLAASAAASPTPLPFLAEALKPAPWQPEFASTPFPTPTPFAEFSPAPGATVSSSPAIAKAKSSPSPESSPAMTAEQAQAELDKTAEKNNLTLPKETEINKKAMKDFATHVQTLKNQGKLDLDSRLK